MGSNLSRRRSLNRRQGLTWDLDDLLLKQAQLRALQQTPKRDHKSVFYWLERTKPIAKGEDDWILHANDFVSLNRASDGQFAEVFSPLSSAN
jgi:hypothetical protein